jgi:hypothetical protein
MLLNDRDKGEILKLVMTYLKGEDRRIWKFNNNGHYTIKSTYRFAMETLIDSQLIGLLWKLLLITQNLGCREIGRECGSYIFLNKSKCFYGDCSNVLYSCANETSR